MASLIPDSVSDTFADLLDTYQQIEAIKMQKRLAEAQVSLASVNLPHYPSDAQAKAGEVYFPVEQPLSNGAMIGIGLVAVVALVMILKD